MRTRRRRRQRKRRSSRRCSCRLPGRTAPPSSNALVGVTKSTGDSAALLIPAGLLVDDASSGNMPFGETLTLPAKTASRDALTDLLGVRVNSSWVSDQAGLAALVDKVGGVQATVDVDVLAKNAKGEEAVVVRAGSQRLTGSQAAAYASYLADGEPETVRLARFNDVFDGVLRALPASEAAIAATITGLSTGSSIVADSGAARRLLVVLRTAAAKEQLHYDVLPVNDIDTGDRSTPTASTRPRRAPSCSRCSRGRCRRTRTGDTVRVLVENGIGTPDLVTAARVKLVKDGFQFITGGNASEPQIDGGERGPDRGRVGQGPGSRRPGREVARPADQLDPDQSARSDGRRRHRDFGR